MCSHIRQSIKRACLSEARGWYSTLGFLFGFCQTIDSVNISLRFDIACLFLVAIHKHGVCCMNTTVVSSGELLTEESSKNLMHFTACVERPLCVCLKMLGRCDDHDTRVVDLNKCKACYLDGDDTVPQRIKSPTEAYACKWCGCGIVYKSKDLMDKHEVCHIKDRIPFYCSIEGCERRYLRTTSTVCICVCLCRCFRMARLSCRVVGYNQPQ